MARFGILIAACRFPNEPRLEDLRCPENDVDGLAGVLRPENLGDFTELLVLKNKPHHEVNVEINRVFNRAGRDDLVLVYYSGHGKLNLAGRLHLATTDTAIDALEATSISVDNIKSYMDVSNCMQKVLILDCCYSGAVDKIFTRGGVDDSLHMASSGRGTCIMTASTGIQVAVEKETDQYGMFTKHIIEGIRTGKADLNMDGRITTDELYRYVHARVGEEGAQEPMKWDLNVSGELVISRSANVAMRKKKIRIMLLDLAGKEILSDRILNQGLKALSAPAPASGRDPQAPFRDLLERLFDKRMAVDEFSIQWHKLNKADESRPDAQPPPLSGEKHDRESAGDQTSEPKPEEIPTVEATPLVQTQKEKDKASTTTGRPRRPEPFSPKSTPERKRPKGPLVLGLLLTILAIAVGAIYFRQYGRETLALKLETDPPGAAISIDGRDMGPSPVSVDLPIGEDMALRIEKDGYITHETTLRIRPGMAESLRFELRPAAVTALSAKLIVTTEPPGAAVNFKQSDLVYSDGMAIQKGAYIIEVSATHFQTETRKITIRGGEIKQETVRLKPATATLTVRSDVRDDMVYIDDKAYGPTRLDLELPMGKQYVVRVEKPDHSTWTQNVDLAGDLTLQATLEPLPGALSITTVPPDASVRFKDGKRTYSDGMSLEPGNYTLVVSKKGFKSRQIQAAISPNKSEPINVALEPEATQSAERVSNPLGMTFVYIPPGTFTMGSPADEPGRYERETQHKVTLKKGFYMQTTEVTQGQWKAVMGNNPSRFKKCGDDCPVENVSWDDAQAFIKKLNNMEGGDRYRLPTEAEWEYACRAGTTTALYNGPIDILGKRNAPALDPIAWYGGNSGVEYEGGYDSSDWPEKQYDHKSAGTHPVGQKKPNDWGLYDMIGNVWEWVEDDWHGSYSGAPVDGGAWVDDPRGGDRVLRGGSWNAGAWRCRSAWRYGYGPGFRLRNFGFRLLLPAGR